MVINHLLSFMGYCPYDSHLMPISLFPYYAHDMINIYTTMSYMMTVYHYTIID